MQKLCVHEWFLGESCPGHVGCLLHTCHQIAPVWFLQQIKQKLNWNNVRVCFLILNFYENRWVSTLSEEPLWAEALSSGCRCRHLKGPWASLWRNRSKSKHRRELHPTLFSELGIGNYSKDEWRERKLTYIFIVYIYGTCRSVSTGYFHSRDLIITVLTVLLNMLVQLQACMPPE